MGFILIDFCLKQIIAVINPRLQSGVGICIPKSPPPTYSAKLNMWVEEILTTIQVPHVKTWGYNNTKEDRLNTLSINII